MSLRGKLLSYVVAVMAIVFIMVLATLTPDALNETRVRATTGHDTAQSLKIVFEQLSAAQREKLLAGETNFFTGQMLDGWFLASNDGKIQAWMMRGPRPDSLNQIQIAQEHMDHFEQVLTPDGQNLMLYARTNISSLRPSLDVWNIFVVMAVGTLLLVMVIYGLMLRLVVKPVEHLARASRAAVASATLAGRSGVLRPLLPPVPHTNRLDEIGELVRAYNKMTDEVNDLRVNLESRVTQAKRELEAAQNQIVLSERLSVAGRLAAGVAHEINNPLGGMLNAARTLQNKAAPGTREHEYLELIMEGLGRVQGIVTTMLQFSRPAKEASQVELPAVIDGALLFCAHRFGKMKLKLEKDYPSGEPLCVWGHRSELGQVFLNLIVNALDAMDGNASAPHKLTLRLRHDGSAMIVSIADTGSGMSPEVREHAGEFFFSTKKEGHGTGLGLAVVQHIVLQHGGSMNIESNEQSGTTITLKLPAEQPVLMEKILEAPHAASTAS